MRESVLRTWHRNLGIVLAVFIIFQAGSGFFISLSQMSVSHTHAHEESHPSHTFITQEGFLRLSDKSH
jgi:hypothetical protein